MNFTLLENIGGDAIVSCGSAAQELYSVRVRELSPRSIVIDGLKKLNDTISLPLRNAYAHEGLLASIVGHLDVLHSLTGGLGESHGYISLGDGLAHDVVGLAVVGRVLLALSRMLAQISLTSPTLTLL